MLNRIEVEGKPIVYYHRHMVGDTELHVHGGGLYKDSENVRPWVLLSTGDATLSLNFTPETLHQLADELDAANIYFDECVLIVASMQKVAS